MKTRKNIVAMAVTGTLGAAALLSAVAAGAASATTPAAADATHTMTRDEPAHTREQAMIQTAEEAFTALREVRASRMAIFDGVADVAAKLAADAGMHLETAKGKSASLAIRAQEPTAAGDVYLPVDVSIALAQGFMPTQEMAPTLHQANDHLSNGDHKAAVEVLRAANIDVSVTAALIPVGRSIEHIRSAIALMEQQKFYEANLALKAVENSVVVEHYDADAIPPQGVES